MLVQPRVGNGRSIFCTNSKVNKYIEGSVKLNLGVCYGLLLHFAF